MIVPWIIVAMMDHFFRQEIAPELGFHHKPVLQHIAILSSAGMFWSQYQPVPIWIAPAAPFPGLVLRTSDTACSMVEWEPLSANGIQNSLKAAAVVSGNLCRPQALGNKLSKSGKGMWRAAHGIRL